MGIGLDGKRDLSRTAGVINQMELDLIGLQEVDNHTGEAGDDLGFLGQQTGMEVIAGPTMRRATGDYGNALLTRLPLLHVERYDLSIGHHEPRGLLIVHQDWHGKGLQVAVTHLGLRPAERRRQVRIMIERLSSGERTPLILMGDFNEWLIRGRPMRWLRDHFGPVSSPRTFPSRWPLFRLDHILADPPVYLHSLKTYSIRTARDASDHLPLVGIFGNSNE
jgi:endonuclease/exonuclease/phosphatase family metal-dependent hydrolase